MTVPLGRVRRPHRQKKIESDEKYLNGGKLAGVACLRGALVRGYSNHRRHHVTGQHSGDHGAKTEAREVVAPLRRECADAADMIAILEKFANPQSA